MRLTHCRSCLRCCRWPTAALVMALAAMSLQFTVSKAVVEGMIRDGLAFKRTEKGGLVKKRKADRPAQTETVMGLLLLSGAVWLWMANQFEVYEQNLFALTVLIQSIPFLCTTTMSLIEEFQNWRAARAETVHGKVGE